LLITRRLCCTCLLVSTVVRACRPCWS
jgi:hypothetical protein